GVDGTWLGAAAEPCSVWHVAGRRPEPAGTGHGECEPERGKRTAPLHRLGDDGPAERRGGPGAALKERLRRFRDVRLARPARARELYRREKEIPARLRVPGRKQGSDRARLRPGQSA